MRVFAPSTALQRMGLWTLAASGLPKLLAHRYSGVGAILAFHRIRHVESQYSFASRRSSIEPDNFIRIISALRERNYEFVSMDEVVRRLENPRSATQKVVSLTFDDGYDDTYYLAFKICRTFQLPMTVYLIASSRTRALADWSRSVPMWWLGLEQAIATNDEVHFYWNGTVEHHSTRTAGQKRHVYFLAARRLVDASPQTCYEFCSYLGMTSGVDFVSMTIQQSLTPWMIAEMKASGLVTFGAHTVNHSNLRRLTLEEARHELSDSKNEIENVIGVEVRHFAYPYGGIHEVGPRELELSREAGFLSAVTTRMATLDASDRHHLHSLPRLTVNGEFQGTMALDLLLSGVLPKAREAVRTCQERLTRIGARGAP